MLAVALLPFLAAAPAVSAQTANLAPTVVVAEPNGGERLSSVPEPEGHGAPFLIVYAATDPDGDPVTVRLLAIQQAGAVGAPPLTGPIVIADGLPATGTFLWDTRTIPDGAGYRIRVEATDNGAGGVPGSGGVPLTGADETDGRFLVDNTPPTASLSVVEGDYLSLDQLSLAATVGDLPFFPPEGVVRPHARPLHITLTLDPGDPGERALEPGDTLDLAAVAPGRHRVRLHVRDQSGLVANDVRVIHVLTAAEGFALAQERLEALQADPTCAPGALPALAEAHALLAAALQRQRSGNVQGFVQKLAETAGQLQIAGTTEPRAGALAETLALLVRDLLQPRVEYLESALGVADPQVTPIRSFFTAGLALLAGGNFSGAILEFKKAQNRINALDTQSPEIVRIAPEERYLQTGEFTVRYGFADFLTDIAPISVLLEVDGVNRTAEATRSDQRLRIEFAGATALSEGDHEFRLTVVDVQGNPATRVDRIWVDLAAPTAAWTSPAEGWVTSNRPLARLEYADAAPGSGIDPAEGVQILLDGADVTTESLRGEEFATHQAPFGSELTEGTHVYSATIQDRSGRSITDVRTFAVDSIPPLVEIASPTDGSSTSSYVLDYRVLASDANGVALVSATINDQEATAYFTTEPDGFLWHPVTGDPVFLQLGENVFRVTVADPAGNSVERMVTIWRTTAIEDGPIPPLYVLKIEEGDDQEGAIGQCLEGPPIDGSMLAAPGKPLRVSVRDAHNDNRPVAGVPLHWEGPGSVVEAPGYSTVTDAGGMAAVRYLTSRVPGTEEIRCSVLGDDSVAAVTFHAKAVRPDFLVEMPYRWGGEAILLGSGEAFLKATLTRLGTVSPLVMRNVRVESNVRVQVLNAAGGLLGDPPGIYVNPRVQVFNARGQAGIDVIADTVGPWNEVEKKYEGPWRVRVSVDDFPELPPFEFDLVCVPDAIRAGFASMAMLTGTPAGQITAPGHPIQIRANLTPMRMPIPGDDEHNLHYEHYTLYLDSPLDDAGAPIYEFAQAFDPIPPAVAEWHPGVWFFGQDDDPNVAVRVRPIAGSAGLRPAPVRVQLLYQILRRNPDGTSEGIFGTQRLETVAVGAPEVRVVREDSDGQLVNDVVPTASSATIKTAAQQTGPFFFCEARVPTDIAVAEIAGTLRALDRSGIALADDGRNPPVVRDVTLQRIPAEGSPRAGIYRSSGFLGIIEPRTQFEREQVAPITPTPSVSTGTSDIVGPIVDFPPDDLPENVVRTGSELRVEVPIAGTVSGSQSRVSAQIVGFQPDRGAKRPVNGRVNLCAGEPLAPLRIEVEWFSGRPPTWVTLDLIDDPKATPPVQMREVGNFEFEGLPGIPPMNDNSIDIGPLSLADGSGTLILTVPFVPDPVSGEAFHEFSVRERDSRGNAPDARRPLSDPSNLGLRIGPNMSVVNLVVQFAGTRRSRSELVEDLRVVNAIWKQACIQFELVDSDVVSDPLIGGRKPPRTAVPEDIRDGPKKNMDEYLDFRNEPQTKVNVFLVEAVAQAKDEANTVGAAIYGAQFCAVEGALDKATFQTALAHELGHVLGDLDDAYPKKGDSAALIAEKDLHNKDMLMYHTGQSAHRLPVTDAKRCRENPRATPR